LTTYCVHITVAAFLFEYYCTSGTKIDLIYFCISLFRNHLLVQLRLKRCL